LRQAARAIGFASGRAAAAAQLAGSFQRHSPLPAAGAAARLRRGLLAGAGG
jgi:hypothetical protein